MPFNPPNRSMFVWEVEQLTRQYTIPLPLTSSGKPSQLLDERNDIALTTTGRYIAVPKDEEFKKVIT